MLRKIELGRGLDVQLSEKKSLDGNMVPCAACRPQSLRFLTNPVAMLLIVTPSASLITHFTCFAYFAKNASNFAKIGLGRFSLLISRKKRRAKAKECVVAMSSRAYSDAEHYEC